MDEGRYILIQAGDHHHYEQYYTGPNAYMGVGLFSYLYFSISWFCFSVVLTGR